MYEYGYGVPIGMDFRTKIRFMLVHLFTDYEQAFNKYRRFPQRHVCSSMFCVTCNNQRLGKQGRCFWSVQPRPMFRKWHRFVLSFAVCCLKLNQIRRDETRRCQSTALLQDFCKERMVWCIYDVRFRNAFSLFHILYPNIIVFMLAKTLDQSSILSFEGDDVNGLCSVPFPAERRCDVCGLCLFPSVFRDLQSFLFLSWTAQTRRLYAPQLSIMQGEIPLYATVHVGCGQFKRFNIDLQTKIQQIKDKNSTVSLGFRSGLLCLFCSQCATHGLPGVGLPIISACWNARTIMAWRSAAFSTYNFLFKRFCRPLQLLATDF